MSIFGKMVAMVVIGLSGMLLGTHIVLIKVCGFVIFGIGFAWLVLMFTGLHERIPKEVA